MNNNSDQRESTIIQNITLSHHFVSDIGLQFSPREVKDLTWEDPMLIKKSKDLKDSLRRGILKQLSEQEYEKTMNLQYQREHKELLKDQQNKIKLENIEIEGEDKEFLADTFDVSEARRNSRAEVDITGTANHPMSYVAAFEIAQAQAQEGGDTLTAEEFAILVENDARVVPALLSMNKTASTQKSQNVYYASPNSEFGNNTGVVKTTMSNINRDLGGPDVKDLESIKSKVLNSLDLDLDYVSESKNEGFAESIEIDTDEIVIGTD